MSNDLFIAKLVMPNFLSALCSRILSLYCAKSCIFTALFKYLLLALTLWSYEISYKLYVFVILRLVATCHANNRAHFIDILFYCKYSCHPTFINIQLNIWFYVINLYFSMVVLVSIVNNYIFVSNNNRFASKLLSMAHPSFPQSFFIG